MVSVIVIFPTYDPCTYSLEISYYTFSKKHYLLNSHASHFSQTNQMNHITLSFILPIQIFNPTKNIFY